MKSDRKFEIPSGKYCLDKTGTYSCVEEYSTNDGWGSSCEKFNKILIQKHTTEKGFRTMRCLKCLATYKEGESTPRKIKGVSSDRVFIMFSSTCPKCEYEDRTNSNFSVPVSTLVEIGAPICPICGEDMSITGRCVIVK